MSSIMQYGIDFVTMRIKVNTKAELDKLVNTKGQSYDDLVRMLINERRRNGDIKVDK